MMRSIRLTLQSMSLRCLFFIVGFSVIFVDHRRVLNQKQTLKKKWKYPSKFARMPVLTYSHKRIMLRIMSIHFSFTQHLYATTKASKWLSQIIWRPCKQIEMFIQWLITLKSTNTNNLVALNYFDAIIVHELL